MDTFPYSEISWYLKKIIKGIFTTIVTSKPLFQFIVYHIFRFGHMHKIRFINQYVETELDLTGKENIPITYLRKMMPMQARLVLSKIQNVESHNLIRITNAKKYYNGLSDLPEIICAPLMEDGSHIYNYYPIQYHDRNNLVGWLIKNRSDVGVQHLKNTADLPAFKKYYRDCTKARKTANEVILLPTYPNYGDEMINKNIEIIRALFQ